MARLVLMHITTAWRDQSETVQTTFKEDHKMENTAKKMDTPQTVNGVNVDELFGTISEAFEANYCFLVEGRRSRGG